MGARSMAVALAALASLATQDAERETEVVRVARSDGGRTTRFDPARVEKNYQIAANALKQALSRLEKKATSRMEEGPFDSAASRGLAQDKYDAGLPDPVRTVRRTWRPSSPLPRQIRGTTIYVVTVNRNGNVHGLPKAPLGRTDIVLVSRAARLGTITLLTREVAENLGIRTSRARCVVNADGSEIEITEGDLP